MTEVKGGGGERAWGKDQSLVAMKGEVYTHVQLEKNCREVEPLL